MVNGRLKEQFFDFEVFPNWWCCVVGQYPYDDNIPESIKDDFLVVTSDDSGARELLINAMANPERVNFGYNIKRYDNIILNGVANGFTPRQLKILNDCIIDPETQYSSHEAMRIAPFAKRRYNSKNYIYQDMMDDNTGSLKEKEACMQLDIRESTIPFTQETLSDADKAEIISYCKHDVWAGMQFYKQVLKSFVATKLLVGKVFGIPVATCYKSTNAVLSGIALGAERTSFPDRERQDIEIPKALQQYINYSLPSDIVKRLCASPDKFTADLFGNEVSYSNGGIHSIPLRPKGLLKKDSWSLQVKATDDWVLCDVDASSFYPALMIYYKLLSRGVRKPELFAEMYQARLDFKKVIEPYEDKFYRGEYVTPEETAHYQYCKDTSQAYKLILNTTYGASGNKWLALYDPYMTTSTCRVGQLVITSLANNIYNQIGKDKVQIVQTNTDGVLCYIRKDMLPMLHKIGDEFTRVTQILLEYGSDKVIWQRDVNNYLMLQASGKEKSKGGYFVTDMIQPGYNRVRPLDSYVCREAIKMYLKERKDIVEHIYGETDISKFVITCHKGNSSGILREHYDRPDEELHRVNRVYASLNKNLGEIKLLRRRGANVNKHKAPGCPPHCELINEALDKYDINELRKDIDYMWYIERTVELLSDHWYEMKENKIISYDMNKELLSL